MKLKSTIGWLLAMCVWVPASADITTTRFSHNGEKKTTVFGESCEIVKNECARLSGNESAATENATVEVTVKLSYPENMKPWFIQYGEALFGPTWEYEGNDAMSILFTPQEWCPNVLLTWFRADNGDSHGVFTQVDSFKDGMVIEVDASKAVNKFETRFLKKDGTLFTVAQIEYNPDDETETVVAEGDVRRFFGTSFVSYNELPYISQDFFIDDRTNVKTGIRKISSSPVFYLNDLPEGFLFASSAIGYSTDGTTQYFVQTDCGRNPGTYSNNPALWAHKEFSFMPGRTTQENGGVIGYTAGNAVDLKGHLNQTIKMGVDALYVAPGKPITLTANVCSPSSGDIETLCECIINETVNGENCSVDGPLFRVKDNTFYKENLNILPSGYMSILGDIWQYTPGNRENGLYKEHLNPYLPASLAEYEGIYGNTVPITVTLMPMEEDEPLPEEFFEMLLDMGWLHYGYLGRNGEVRTTDLFATDVKQSTEGGTHKFTITNANTLIDGKIPGINTTELNCIMAATDWFPPTMQTLMFRDGNGHVTDRLNQPENAVVEFYAGDFKIKYDEEGLGCMEVEPLKSVKVEYSSHGSDTWTEIHTEEIPEMFFMPGYGYFYRGSLKGINKTSLDKWYDVRITLTDKTGNYQTQTISPAFHIDSNSGVSSIENTESIALINKNDVLSVEGIDCPEVRVFDMTGRLIMLSSDRKINISSIPSGIYVVEVSSSNIKKVFKKLFK